MINPTISEYKTLRPDDVLNDKRFLTFGPKDFRETISFMYLVLWMIADDQGRVDGDVNVIISRAARYGYTKDEVVTLIQRLLAMELIYCYEATNYTLIQIIDYVERQRWNGMRQSLPSNCYPASDEYPDVVANGSTSGNWIKKYDYTTGKLRNGDTPLTDVNGVGLTPLSVVKNNKTKEVPIVSNKSITNSLTNSPQGGGSVREGEQLDDSANPDDWSDEKIIEEVKILIGKQNRRRAAPVTKEHAGTILSKVREYGGKAVLEALKIYLKNDFYSKWRHTSKIFANQMKEFMVIDEPETETHGPMKPAITPEEAEAQLRTSADRVNQRKADAEEKNKQRKEEEKELLELENSGL